MTIKCGEGWEVDETGVYKLSESDSKKAICSPIWVDSWIIDTNSGSVKVLIKGLNKITNRIFTVITEKANLLAGMHNPLLRMLANQGASISQGENNKVFEYLEQQTASVIYGFDKLGWHKSGGQHLFVLPKQIVGGQEHQKYCFLPEGQAPSQSGLTTSGTLESWQQNIALACVGNPVPLFALGIAFAAPLMDLFNQDGGAFHFGGHSSRGKTTLLQIASSVWGNAADPAQAPQHSLIQRWNTTANALEGTALAYNDLLLPMDELGTSNIKNFGHVIYQLAGGKGKAAMNAAREIRPPRVWKTLIMSTGEHTIAHEVEATTGAEARAGQLIRFIDIGVDGNIFPTFTEEVANKVTALKLATSQHYGVAAIPYLQHLVDIANSPSEKEIWTQRFEYVEGALLNSYLHLQPEQQRAMKRFTLVAVGLMLAVEAGCIQAEDDTILDAVLHVIGLWLKDFPTISESERGIDTLKQTIQMSPGRFANAQDALIGGSNYLGYYHHGLKLYLIPVKSMTEVCGRPNYKSVIAKLDELGVLVKNNKTNTGEYRQTFKLKLANGQYMSGFAISYQLFNDDEEQAA